MDNTNTKEDQLIEVIKQAQNILTRESVATTNESNKETLLKLVALFGDESIYTLLKSDNIMGFRTKLKIEAMRGTDKYILLAPLVFKSMGLGLVITAPLGLATNFASIPKIARVWIDNDSKIIREASVIHDYLYSKISTKLHPDMSRKVADKILIEAMGCLGASEVKQRAVYWSLRWFGYFAYKKT